MLRKLVHTEKETIYRHCIKFGITNFDDLPTPNREVSDSYFWNKIASHIPIAIEYRQIAGISNFIRNCHLYYMTDEILVMAFPAQWTCKGNEIVYTEQPKYFSCGCDHKFREIDSKEAKRRNIIHHGNCYHVVECQSCGTIQSFDSGD